MKTPPTQLNTPWALHFDHDGTEDIAIIRDANDEELIRSRPFWLPEGDNPIPPTLAALLAAAKATLTALELMLEMDEPAASTRADWEVDPLEMLRAAVIEAESFEGAE